MIKKALKYFLWISLGVIMLNFIYFWFSMTIGDTIGLQSKLEENEYIESVEEFYKYEGTVEALLQLSSGGSLRLGNLENVDFDESDGLVLLELNSKKILCFNDGVVAHGLTLDSISELVGTVKNVNQILKKHGELSKILNAQMVLEIDGWRCQLNEN